MDAPEWLNPQAHIWWNLLRDSLPHPRPGGIQPLQVASAAQLIHQFVTLTSTLNESEIADAGLVRLQLQTFDRVRKALSDLGLTDGDGSPSEPLRELHARLADSVRGVDGSRN